jgi:ATP-dependent protease ClpP protease subunit
VNPLGRIRSGKIQAFKDTGVLPEKDFRCEVGVGAGAAFEMWLYDVIDSDGWFGVTASDVVMALGMAGGEDVVVHVNSPGGMATEGLAIYNTFKNYTGKVTMRVEGMAASAASIVILAGNEVVVEPASLVMIHDAWGATVGPADDHLAQADVLNKLSDVMAVVYSEESGGTQTPAYWRTQMKANNGDGTWYTGQEAVDAGLADTLNVNSTSADEAVAKWDPRTLFAKAPTRVAASAAGTKKPEPAFDFAALREGLKGVLK